MEYWLKSIHIQKSEWGNIWEILGTDEKAWVPYLEGRISLVWAGLPKMILNVQAYE